MNQISVYIDFWEYLRVYGSKTIEKIESENAWNYKNSENEFSIIQTFNHTLQAIFEDAGTWFLKDSKKYKSTDNQKDDLDRSIDRMIQAIKDLKDENLEEEFAFQWGEKTTTKDAIKQNMFHAVSHFGQLRERIGILQRNDK